MSRRCGVYGLEVVMDLVDNDADDLEYDIVQFLSLCHCCTRSLGCLDVIIELCCCHCLMLSWKMWMDP